jgi:hypothetical protein
MLNMTIDLSKNLSKTNLRIRAHTATQILVVLYSWVTKAVSSINMPGFLTSSVIK